LAIRFAPTWRNAAGTALPGRIGATRALPALATQLPIPGHTYQGRSDGLASQLRKQYPDAAYVGIEFEVNQRFVL
jgi:hypothetical protein